MQKLRLFDDSEDNDRWEEFLVRTHEEVTNVQVRQRFEQRHKGVRVSPKRSVCDGLGWMRRLPP